MLDEHPDSVGPRPFDRSGEVDGAHALGRDGVGGALGRRPLVRPAGPPAPVPAPLLLGGGRTGGLPPVTVFDRAQLERT
ncbi:hypothetical protein, partial [Streptomyces sp. wa22]|uniref:hypothetical protein n=1 Tax=Streptomyces sp. wa22 TaxID=1828244 RepID=UPI002905D3D7